MVLTPKYHSGPDLPERQPNVQLVLGNKEAAVPVMESKCGWSSKSLGKIKCFPSAVLRSQRFKLGKSFHLVIVLFPLPSHFYSGLMGVK